MSALITNPPPPPSPRRRGRFLAQVIRNEAICTEHFRLTLALQNFPLSLPGQFIQLNCNDDLEATNPISHMPHEIDWPPPPLPPVAPLATTSNVQRPTPNDSLFTDADFLSPRAYLRRPFSIAARRDLPNSRSEIDIIHRVAGKGTGFLATLKPNAEISLLGPMGNGFWVPEDMTLALLVGGGVGIPPMFYLAHELARQNKPAIAFVGAQRQELVPLNFSSTPPSPQGEPTLCAKEFSDLKFPTVITTDDGSLGMKGFITAALRKFLEKNKPSEISTRDPEPGTRNPPPISVVFCCGPTPMMRATAAVCEEFGVLCQLSLEQPMACGMGTCQSCVIKWRKLGVGSSKLEAPSSPMSASPDWVYKLTCQEGPVFDSREIMW